MDCREDLEQQIWEFIYGLLPENEADDLNRQITSDPDTARLYAEIRLQADVLAEAAQLHEPPLSLAKPSDVATEPSTEAPDNTSVRPRPLPTAARVANWVVGLAAALLVCVMVQSYFKPDSSIRDVAVRSQQQELMEPYILTTLYGSKSLQAKPANIFTVQTRSAVDGKPRSAVPINYRGYGEDETLLFSGETETDTGGLARIETPPETAAKNVRVEVSANNGISLPAVERSLPVHDVELTTHLTLDKPLYRPGETIKYRSVTLSRFGLRVRREVTVEFHILDPKDSVVAGSQSENATQRGVGAGKFAIAENQPGGKHILVTRSPSDEFPEARKDFYIRQYRTPTLKKQLEFVRDSFGPGDEVVAKFKVERAEGGVIPNAALRILAKVDDHPNLLNLHTAADEYGAYEIRFALPDEVQAGDGLLSVTIDEDGRETITKAIPVNLGDVSVEFFPESGELVTGVENRVYFHAHDSVDKPVHVESRILDSRDQEVAAAKTIHEGRGKFSFTPLEGEKYRLKIDTPSGAADGRPLPETSDRQFVTLNTGEGVFDAGQPIALRVHSTQCYRLLAVTAVCRGAIAGHQVVSVDQFVSRGAGMGSCDVTVRLAEHADGVIRLTAYDLSARPPQPIAERLVYRRPAHRLDIQVTGQGGKRAPGDEVDVGLLVQDETGQPQQAVLGISVVDDALLALADDKSPQMTTHFWLTSQIEKPEELDDANFYLKEEPEAAVALDLVLGTQGWRRFTRVPLDHLAGTDVSDARDGKKEPKSTILALAISEPAAPVVLADNSRQSRGALEDSVEKFHNDRQLDVRRTGQVVFAGGVAVLIAMGIMGLLRMTAGAKVWAPTAVVATVSLVFGSLWMDAQIAVQDELAGLPRVPEAEKVEHAIVAKVEETTPEVAVEKMRKAPEPADAKPGVSAEKMKRVSEKLAEAIEAEEQEDAAVEEVAKTVPLARASTTADKGLQAANEAPVPEAMADAVSSAPAPAIAAAEPAATPAEPTDQPAAEMDAEEEGEKRGGMGLGGMGGGVIAGLARDESRELADVEAKKMDGVEIAPALPRAPTRGAMMEREKKGEAGAFKRELDVLEDAPLLAQDDVAQPRPDEAKNQLDTLRARGVAGAVAPGGGERDLDFRKQFRRAFGEDGKVPVRVYGGFSPKYFAFGMPPLYAENLLWDPLLPTDADGRASVKFKLPGVVTTYRVLVDGHVDGRIGSGEGKIILQTSRD